MRKNRNISNHAFSSEAGEKIWASAREMLQTILNPEIFRLWFASIRPIQANDETIRLGVTNDFCEIWLKENYLGLLKDVLAHVTGKSWKIEFEIATPDVPAPEAELLPAPKPKSKGAASLDPSKAQLTFNPHYTFDNFVVGSNNHFAQAAAIAVAQAPGKSYNPLFLYGGVGLGKTHLLHAIGQHVVQSRRHARVAYLSSEKFTNDYISAIQDNQLGRFRRRYRQTEVLLIDDVQFLSGKERIQEEFFHTFNALHESHKQIVLTCDRPANEIQNLEKRLVSRFEWGLATDLQPPDVEVRIAILRKKAGQLGAELPDDIINFLASRVRSNIRRLEGALIRVISFASLTGKALSIELVEGLLRDLLHEEARCSISIESIQKRVADHYDIRLGDMTSKRRPEHIAFPRQIAMFLSRQLTESSLNTIGEAFGGRDHGTVLHACRLVKDRMDVDAGVRQAVHYLERQLLR